MRHRSSSVDSYATRLAIKTAYDASVAMEARASALGMFNISIGWRGSVYCLYCDNKIVAAAREAQRRKKPPIKVPQMHVSTFCGTVRSGLKAGAPTQALFHTPDAMILLASGSVLLCDSGNHTVSLISPDGHCTHLIASSCLLQPAGLTVIHNEVIVADSGHHRLRRCSLATHAPSDMVERSHKDGGVTERSHHHHSHHCSNRSTNASQPVGHGCRPLVGTGRRGWEDGSIAGVGGSQLHNPAGLAILTDSPQQVELVVADRGNHCLRLVTLSPVRGEHRNGVGNGNGNGNMSRQTSPPPEWRGKVQTIAGKPGVAGHADGMGLTALFASPTAVVVWDADTLLVADSGNCCVRRLCRSLPSRGRPRGRGSECEGHGPSLSSWTVSTVCGHPSRRGFRDGPLAKAMFQSIVSLAIMPDRSLAICDYENHRIRWLAPNFKTVATLAGNGEGTWKNGPGSSASFCHPRAICLGMYNSLLVADGGNHCVRLLQPQEGGGYSMPNHPSPHRPPLPLQTLLSQAHATAGAIAMPSPQGTPLQPSRMELEGEKEEAEEEEELGAGHSPRALLQPPPPATAFLQQFVPHAPMSGRALEARQTPRVRQGRYYPSEAETSTLRQAHIVDGRYSAIFQQTDTVKDEEHDNSHDTSDDDAIDNQEEQVEEKEVDDELVVAAELKGVVEVGDAVGTETEHDTEHDTEHVHVHVLEGEGNVQPVRSPLPQATPSLSELASPVAQAIARTQALNDSLLQEEENRYQHRPPANERRGPSPLSLEPPSYLQPADSTTVYPLPPHSHSRPSHHPCDMAASDSDPPLTQVLQRMLLLMDNRRDSEEQEEEDRGVAAYRSESTGQGRFHSPYGTYTVSIALATATAQQNVASFYEENAWLMARGSMPEAATACLSSALSLSAAVKAVYLRQQMQMEQALCAFDPDFFAQTQTTTRSALDTLIQRVCSPQMGWSEVALVDNSHQLVVAHQGQLHCAAGMTYTCSIALLTPVTSPMVPASTSASNPAADTAIVYLGDIPCPSVKCRRLSPAEGGPYRVEILAKVTIPNAYCPSVHANELTSQHIPQLTVEWRQSSLQATTQVALPLCVYPSQAACDRQMARMEEAVVQRAVALPKELQLLGMHTTRALNTLQFTTVPDSVQDSTLE
jgi:hypothetical protein